MSFLQKLVDFFQALLNPASEDAMKKQAVRKVESDLRMVAPNLYRNGLVQVNFAEGLRVLYFNTAPIADILSQTYCSSDHECSMRFEQKLIYTGFDEETQELLNELSYENRKKGAMEAQSLTRYFESEHRKLEKVVKALNTTDFVKIDEVFDRLNQLNDICRFSYLSTLRLFDSGFKPDPAYTPDFQPIPPDLMETALLDLYYVAAEMDISSSLYNAVLALAALSDGKVLSDERASALKTNLKKIQSLMKHVFTKEVLMLMTRLAKKNADFIPDRAVYKLNIRQKFADFLENRFRIEENRLKGEIQDYRISSDMRQIFGNKQLMPISGYSNDLNNQLVQSTACSFMWIMPMQILKNFIIDFYEEHLRSLLNDIVIEGFFNNAVYKTDFSTVIFACNESVEKLNAFEKRFQRGSDFDEANITSLIRDCHKDTAFENTLRDLVDKINKQAKELIQTETSNFFQLYKKINDILIESKKPSSEVIQNLKVLMISSRNKENSDIMEAQYPQWKVFLEIMKNYVIIGSVEKK